MWYENRTICAVFDDMRALFKAHNFGAMLGLIEEAQVMANRMEHGLSQKESIEEWDIEWRKMRRERDKLDRDIKNLQLKVLEKEETK